MDENAATSPKMNALLRTLAVLSALLITAGCRANIDFGNVPPLEPITQNDGQNTDEETWEQRKEKSARWDNDVLREGHVGYVRHVVDGDTLDVQIRDRYLKVRFQGASAPECEKDNVQVERTTRLQCVADDEFFGLQSARILQQIVQNHEVIVYCEGVGEGQPCALDHYGRTLANLRLDDGRDVGEELIRAGAGWASTAFPSETRPRFCAAEYEAIAAKRGMWAEGDVPSVLRRMNGGTQRWYRDHDTRCDDALKGL